MCGIFGVCGTSENAIEIVTDGLRRLEYRGYDSWGIASTINSSLSLSKDTGRLPSTTSELKTPLAIGHTRWATHGGVTRENAHPHLSPDGTIAVVHNGIIENYTELKEEYNLNKFESQTDSEVIAHLIQHYRNGSLEKAVRKTTSQLVGTFAIAVIDKNEDKLIVARKGSPLIIGVGEDASYISSDIPGLLPYTRDVIFLEDDEIAVIEKNEILITNLVDSTPKNNTIERIEWDVQTAEKDGYDHYMQKEIYEQPESIRHTLKALTDSYSSSAFHKLDSHAINRIIIIACGTSWHAGLVGEFLIEGLASIPVEVEYASEFRYRHPPLDTNTMILAISQSGETADTLAAIREAKKRGVPVMSICNVKGSTIDRASDVTFYTQAGPEIGVASTKAFTTQLTVLYLLTAYLAERNESLSQEKIKELYSDIKDIPNKIDSIFSSEKEVAEVAKEYFEKRNALYLGRGIQFPIALEGALKLKEVSYIHAEGYPAAEMKHGPIALIDPDMPSIIISTRDETESYDKIIGNIQEIKARGGSVIAIATEGDTKISTLADHVLFVPESRYALGSFLSVIPLQLLAYHIARLRKCDIDKPRNLAKSVTVE
ncbi:MAG: glutamine--fructose-6-phosphate transaminase (isomerizing) [Nanobdellota archaeon]